MRARFAALAVLLVVFIGGCGSAGGILEIAQWVGLWVSFTETVGGVFSGWGGFDVSPNGSVVDPNDPNVVHGAVADNGAVDLQTGPGTVQGTLANNGTGQGTYTDPSGNGTWTALKALDDATLYAGTYDVTFAGDATGAGTLTVGADAIIQGIATGTAPLAGNYAGIVGTGGQVIVGDTDANDWIAQGTITPAGGSGTWKTTGGETGTWQATKQ